mmetsp:Transcript_21511/g.31176  ORF Transcript_21511/g.31176 Transcript_21511/m.31176 type:complete len:474 (+) Transcript_21511:270-1691(+)
MRLFMIRTGGVSTAPLILLLATNHSPRVDAFQFLPTSHSNVRNDKNVKMPFLAPSASCPSTTALADLGDGYLDGLSREAALAAKESAEAAIAAAKAAAAAEEAALALAIEEAAAMKAAADAAAAEEAAERAAAAARASALGAAEGKAAADAAAARTWKSRNPAMEGLASGISSLMSGHVQQPPSKMVNLEEEVDEKVRMISNLLDKKQYQTNDQIKHQREMERAKQEQMVEELLRQEQELNERTKVLEEQLESFTEEHNQVTPESSFPAAEMQEESVKDTKTTQKRKKGGALLKINEATIEFTAGFLGGVAGFVVGGPAGAALGAAAANYACKTDNEAGDAVYNLSRSSIEAFNYMIKFEDKYEVLAKAQRRLQSVIDKNVRSNKKINPETLKKLETALEGTTRRMKELDDKYDLVDGTNVALNTIGDLVERGVNTAFRINDDYKVTEKIGETFREAVSKSLPSDSSRPPHKK